MNCAVDDCPNEAKRSGYCWGHLKQLRNEQPLSTLAKRPESSWERLTESANTYANFDAEAKSADFDRARDNLRKSAMGYAKERQSEAAKRAVEKRRARGEPVGRRRKADPVKVAELVAELGDTKVVAEQLQVSVRSVQRWLRQIDTKGQSPVSAPVR